MTRAIYPQSIVTWTDRQDEIDNIWANDPNSIAAETVAIESVLGVQPNIEKDPLSGPPVTYPTVDARISAVARGQNLPFVSLQNQESLIDNNQGIGTQFGVWNTYNEIYDPFKMYNGFDVTIPMDGWWIITINQHWDWWSTGYHGVNFWVDTVFRGHNYWFWDFPWNGVEEFWQGSIGDQRPANTTITWQGPLKDGQRIRALSENGSPHTPHRTYNMELKAACIRELPSNAPFDEPSV
jgi:hypothetical protein